MVIEVRLQAPGGAEGLRPVTCDVAGPGPGELLIKQAAVGVNFLDIYQRTGLYPLPRWPAVLGVEGAGVVEAVGDGVSGFRPGDRIAYAGLPVGGYASERVLPAGRAVPLPDGVPDRVAAASMLRGLTAHMLLRRIYPVRAGDVLLVQAAAGGLGQVVTRWAKQLGASVIATVGSEVKIAVAREAGADHVLLHRDVDLAEQVRALTGGKGVHFAYDGIGGDMLRRTLACVRPFGMAASLGQVGGPIPPLDVAELGPLRPIALSRPSVIAYAKEPDTYRAGAAELFAALATWLHVPAGAEYPLTEAAKAHADLEAGRTTGSVLLIP